MLKIWDTETQRYQDGNCWSKQEKTGKKRIAFLYTMKTKNIYLKKIIKFTLNCVIIEVYKAECIITHFRKGQINEFADLWHFIQQ